jgi:hypothetical protein
MQVTIPNTAMPAVMYAITIFLFFCKKFNYYSGANRDYATNTTDYYD